MIRMICELLHIDPDLSGKPNEARGHAVSMGKTEDWRLWKVGCDDVRFALGVSIKSPAPGLNRTVMRQRQPDKGMRGNEAMSIGSAAHAQ